MYNFTGYIIDICIGAVCTGIGLSTLIPGILQIKKAKNCRSEGKKRQEKRFGRAKLGSGIVTILVGMICVVANITAIIMPKSAYIGEYIDSSSFSRDPLYTRLGFQDESGKGRNFYISIYAEDDIWPQGFKVGEKYKIYHDSLRKIIVRVEEIDEEES